MTTAKSRNQSARQLYNQVWQLLLRERGRNQLRGRWLRDPERLRIGLEFEAVGDAQPGPMLWISIGQTLADCSFPLNNQLFRASDAESLEQWVQIACQLVRRRNAYVRTRDDRADYKQNLAH